MEIALKFLALLFVMACSQSRSSGPLIEGAEAPDFAAPGHDGTVVRLSALRGRPVVLYFYPKDETPGCTLEAERFRDRSVDLTAAGVQLIGVSMDDVASHKAFAANHGLAYPLISDSDGAIAARYGVETSSGHAKRVTFLIGPNGRIAKTFPAVEVQGHDDAVLAAVHDLIR